jgi:hypothetical protein
VREVAAILHPEKNEVAGSFAKSKQVTVDIARRQQVEILKILCFVDLDGLAVFQPRW